MNEFIAGLDVRAFLNQNGVDSSAVGGIYFSLHFHGFQNHHDISFIYVIAHLAF